MPELIPIVLFMCLAGVLILRPVTRKLGLLIEAMARDRAPAGRGAALDEHQVARITAALEQLHGRLDLMEDRLGFVERLIESRPRQRLTG